MLTQPSGSVNTGISESARTTIATGLEKLLADSFMLYLKTLNFHWNVTGPMFQPLHDVFETQYQELAQGVDEIAERIRALDHPAPGTFRQFSGLSSITEDVSLPEATQMIQRLLNDHETAIRTARNALEDAEHGKDTATQDLLTRRILEHEKTAWMLRSFLKA